MNVAEEGSSSVTGFWEPIKYKFNYLPIHVALLHSGKVLGFGGSGNDETQFKTPHPAEIWNPDTGEAKVVNQELDGDLFCAGHSFLADGRLLVAGGTHRYDGKLFGLPIPPFTGLSQAYIFDPVTEGWARTNDMAKGRWYPTLLTLGDGRVVAMAGLEKSFPWVFLRTIEVYSPGAGWSKLEGADRWLPLYPRLHLLPDGKIFYSGSYNTHYTFPFSLRGFPTATLDVKEGVWDIIGLPNKSEREEGTCVLLPLVPPDYRPKVILVGGGDAGGTQAISDCEIIDLSQSNPSWKQVQPMKNARYYAYPVILPDKRILIVGGRQGEKGMHAAMEALAGLEIPQDPMAIHEAEMFDPENEGWTTMASMKLDRLYHSSAILLPDGRVMVCGSNPARRVNELRIEIYDPPYLFKGRRPKIEGVPGEISYGKEFEIVSPDAEEIQDAVLIRPSATTHCVDTEQRLVGLMLSEKTSGSISASIPDNRNLAPPGYYMLFILREEVPSKAAFVHLS